MQVSKSEAFMTGVLPTASGVCYSRGLLVPSACLCGLVALYHFITCVHPVAKLLLASRSRALAAAALGCRTLFQLSIHCLKVTLTFKQFVAM